MKGRRTTIVTGMLALAWLASVPACASSAFQLKPEWAGPCQKAEVVDVNLGHSPEALVRAAHCQLSGAEPAAALVRDWAAKLRKEGWLRRVDVVRSLAKAAGREGVKLAYSSPWAADPELAPPAGAPRTKRAAGAVVMFFFHCPGGVNCGMDWASSHAAGMDRPSPGLAWLTQTAGIYNPLNPGFWRRELRDAKAAGLQFILPNVYGPDLAEGRVLTLAAALAGEADPVKVGLFDDTWPWGEKWFGKFWEQKPDLSQAEATAKLLFEAKWKPYFKQIPAKHWYLIDGRPLIYFYNAGKLNPLNRSSGVLARMKALFRQEFGVEPFVAMERAYFQDPKLADVADAKYTWDPIKYGEGYVGMSKNRLKGRTLAHAMLRWDPFGRDRPGAVAGPGDKLLKGPELLDKVLKDSADADLLVLATWNDLGEGTGLNRNYDYWHLGRWLEPDFFMDRIRRAQFGD